MSSPKLQNLSTILIIAVLAIAGLFGFSQSAKAANVNFTFGAWVKPTSSVATKAILVKDAEMRLFTDGGGKLSCQIHNGTAWQTAAVSSSALSLNSWQYAACVYDGVNVKIYIDGVEVGSQAMTENVQNTANSLNTGKDSGGTYGYFNGFIDSVKIYPYARTAAQIKADYAARGTASGVSAALGGSASSTGGRASMSDGLVGYWKMDEASWSGVADEVVDSSGSGNDGVAVGATGIPTTGAGKFGSGGVFDGVDDYVNMGNNSSLSSSSFTYSFWMNQTGYDATGVGGFLEYINLGSQSSRLYSQINTIILQDAGAVKLTSSSFLNNIWYYISLTFDGTTPKLYINGKLNVTGSASTFASGGSNLLIGVNALWVPSQFFNGSIDEVRIYNRSLSPGEVRDLYNFAPGPVGWWKMDEKVLGNGQTINDSSGYGNTGTTVDGANDTGMDCMVSGKYGGGCEFDGVDDYVDVSINDSLKAESTTVSFWFRTNDIENYQGIIGRFNGNNTSLENRIIWQEVGHKIEVHFRMNSADNTFSASGITDTNWHFVSVVLETGNQKIYIDGIEKASNTIAYPLETGSSNLTIGSAWNAGALDGSIDDVRIYNYARTQAQILEDYAGGAGRKKQPIAHWKFDEGYGTTANNSGIGGSALNGALTNMASPATATSGWTDSGKMGKGLVFDGGDDYVDMGTNSALNISSAITISAWVKSNETYSGTAWNAIASKGANWQDSAYGIATAYSKWYFHVSTDVDVKYIAVSKTEDENIWTHIVGTYDGINLRLFRNGISVASPVATTGTIITKAESLLVGYGRHTKYFNGTIDDVKIYNYALTEDDVRQEYNQGALLKLGSTGTDSSGNPDDSQSREYCIPGDTSTCNPPVGRWDFNEGAGATVNDISGNANTGTWAGTGSHWTQGKVGKGGSFNGSNDYVTFGDRTILDGATQFSLTGWFKYNTYTGKTIISKTYYGYNYRIYGSTGGKLGFTVHNGTDYGYANSNSALTSDMWYHFVGVWDNTNMLLYINGVLQTNIGSLMGGSIQNIGDNLSIGADSSGSSKVNFFNGSIDQVRIYDYARTPAQIAWDYNRGKPVAHWKFDECQGATANDASGNGNDGTITIGVTVPQTVLGTCQTPTDNTGAWYNGRVGKLNSSMSFDGVDDYAQATVTQTKTAYALWVKNGSVWEHVVNNNGTYYINGIAGATPTSYPLYVSGNTVQIGKSDATTFVDCDVDEVKIFNYALTAEQVKMEYSGGAVNFR